MQAIIYATLITLVLFVLIRSLPPLRSARDSAYPTSDVLPARESHHGSGIGCFPLVVIGVLLLIMLRFI